MFKFLLNFIPGVGPFFSAAWTFIVKHWKICAVAGLIGIIFYQNTIETRFLLGLQTIPHLEQVVAKRDAEIVQLKADFAVVIKANQDLRSTLLRQNSTIGEWNTISIAIQKQNEKLYGVLQDMRKDSNTRVSAILDSKTPETCEASIQFLRDMKSRLVW